MIAAHLVPDHTISSITASAIVVWAIEQLKKANWFPLVQKRGTAFAARSLSVIGAAAGSAGITWQWSQGMHSLTISGLTFTAVLLFSWHCVEHFVVQEWIYQSAVNKSSGAKAAASPAEPQTNSPAVKLVP